MCFSQEEGDTKFDSRSTKARDITMIGEILMWLVVVGLGKDPIKA